jgi:hypothetical protein
MDHKRTAVDVPARNERAEPLVDYLGVSERQLLKAVERLTVDGNSRPRSFESSGSRFEHSDPVAKARRLIYLKLTENNQNLDPFKFIIYSGKIGEHTPQMGFGR